MSAHDDIKADLSLYVLGVLTAEETEAIDRHLAEGCAECEGEILRWREVAGLLPFGVDVQAPADLRRELLARATGASPGAAPASAKVVPLRRGWVAPLLAAAAVLALAFGISREVSLRSQAAEQQRVVAELRAALDQASGNRGEAEAELKRVRDALAQREGELQSLRTTLAAAEESLNLLQRPGLELVRLKETADAKPAQGHVLISAATGKALFYAFDLAPLPEGKVYELWWITEKEGPVNAGLFTPEAGLGRVETALPTDAGALKAAAVTIEPSGGVEKPTGPMVLMGSI